MSLSGEDTHRLKYDISPRVPADREHVCNRLHRVQGGSLATWTDPRVRWRRNIKYECI
jgi:hypothetical protein